MCSVDRRQSPEVGEGRKDGSLAQEGCDLDWNIRHVWKVTMEIRRKPGNAISLEQMESHVLIINGLIWLQQLHEQCSTVWKTGLQSS